MIDENHTAARRGFTKNDWVLVALVGLLLVVILIEQTLGVDNVLARLKDLFGSVMAWAVTGVWVALAVKLFWPWIRLWMTFVLMVAIVWFWWRVGGH